MHTAKHLSLAALVLAAGAFCAGCNDAEAVIWLDAHAPTAQEAAAPAPVVQAQPHPCRSAASMSTQKGCRPITATLGSN